MLRSPIIGALALFVAAGSAARAQTTATGSIPAKATVGATVTLSEPTPIDYGTLNAGGTSASVPPSYSATVPHAGSIKVTFANGGISLDVTIDAGNELKRGNDKLTTTLACGIGTTATDAAAAPIGCTGQSFNVTTAVGGQAAYVFVGGQASAPANASAGVYTGTVTVRVSITTQ